MAGYHLRVVFDTNILFAAVIQPSGHLASWVFGHNISSEFTVYISEAILLELQAKLEQKLEYTRVESNITINTLKKVCVLVQPSQKVTFLPDPDDEIILECALEAKADCVYTSDKKLLKMKDFKGPKIFHPSTLKYTFNYSK
jgi:uncharacterized protein